MNYVAKNGMKALMLFCLSSTLFANTVQLMVPNGETIDPSPSEGKTYTFYAINAMLAQVSLGYIAEDAEGNIVKYFHANVSPEFFKHPPFKIGLDLAPGVAEKQNQNETLSIGHCVNSILFQNLSMMNFLPKEGAWNFEG